MGVGELMGTFFAGDLRTGLILARNLPAISGSAQATLNAAGSITCDLTLPMVDPYTGIVVPLIDLIEPCRSFLAYEEGGKIVNAGPVWSDIWDEDTKKYTLNAAGMLSYWNYRYVLPALNDADPTSVPTGHDSTWTSLSLRTIAKRLVQQAQTWTGGAVPLVFEADFTDINARTYLGMDLQNLGEKLAQLNQVLNGPDIAFRPRFATNPNYVEWVMLTGNPELTQNGADLVWDTGTPFPTVRGVSVTRDGTAYRTDDYEVGSAPPDDQTAPPLMTKSYDSTLIARNFPRMEGSSGNHSSVNILDTLQSYSDNAVLMGEHPIETWSFESKIDGEPSLAQVDEGNYGNVKTKNSPRLGTGDHPVRIMQYTATKGSNFIKIDCLPDRS